jgi:hypothetical protein
MWSAGTLKGVSSFNTLVHVKMRVFMVLCSGRNPLPTWVSADCSTACREGTLISRNGDVMWADVIF